MTPVRRRRGRPLGVAVLVGLVLGVVAGPLPAAAGERPRPGHLAAAAVTPVATSTALLVEPETRRVVVAGDDEVAIYSPDAVLLRRIPDLFGVTHLATGGGDVYALLAHSGEVARIDAATLRVTGRWVVTALNDLYGLAVAAGHVWTTGVDHRELGTLASLDPSTGTVRTLATGVRLELTASPAAPGVLVGMFADLQPIRFFRYQVTADGVATPQRSVVHPWATEKDLGISDDGRSLRVVTGSEARVHTLDLATLEERPGTFDLGPYPLAVEPSPTDPGLVLAATSDDLRDGDVYLYRDGSDRPVVGWEASGGDGEVIRGGLAFAPDGTRAYALRNRTTPSASRRAELLVLDPSGLTPVVAPQVVGRQGGGVITVGGLEGPGAIVRIGGEGTIRSVGGDGRTAGVFVPPDLRPGLVDVSATGASGSFRLAASQLMVAYLGPFRTGRAFVDRQVRDAAGRPATDAEVRAEEDRIIAGAEPSEVLVRQARGPSFARHRAPLIRLYRAVFLRVPDTAGLQHWVGELQRGRSLASVGQAFAASPEFRDRYGALSDQEFVTRIYTNVFGRSPDSGGRAYWLDRLRTGTSRGQVVTLMSQSAEHTVVTAGLVDVSLLHLLMLRRAATTAEVEQLRTRPALDVALGVLRSAEYAARIG